jgi:hypothetical protein
MKDVDAMGEARGQEKATGQRLRLGRDKEETNARAKGKKARN